jgi:ATP-binding cassette subfamily B protein
VLRHALPYKKQLIIITLEMVLMAALDSTLPLFTRYAIDKMITPKDTSGLLGFCLLYLVVIVVGLINVAFFIHLTGQVETGMNYDLRRKCFAKLQAMQVGYYDRTPTGWLVARMTSDISRLGDIVAWGIVDMAWGQPLSSSWGS